MLKDPCTIGQSCFFDQKHERLELSEREVLPTVSEVIEIVVGKRVGPDVGDVGERVTCRIVVEGAVLGDGAGFVIGDGIGPAVGEGVGLIVADGVKSILGRVLAQRLVMVLLM